MPRRESAAAVAHEETMAGLGLARSLPSRLPSPAILAKMYRDEPIRTIVSLCAVNPKFNKTVCGNGVRHQEFWRSWGDEQRQKDNMQTVFKDMIRDAGHGSPRLLEYAVLSGVDLDDVAHRRLHDAAFRRNNDKVLLWLYQSYPQDLRLLEAQPFWDLKEWISKASKPLLMYVATHATHRNTLLELYKASLYGRKTAVKNRVLNNPNTVIDENFINTTLIHGSPIADLLTRLPTNAGPFVGPATAALSAVAYNNRPKNRAHVAKLTQNAKQIIDDPRFALITPEDSGYVISRENAAKNALQLSLYDFYKRIVQTGRAGSPNYNLWVLAMESPGRVVDKQIEGISEETASDLLDFLVQLGADVNAPYGPLQFTPLFAAAERMDAPAIAIALLKAGARTEVTNAEGRTPLDHAIDPRMQQLLQRYAN